MPTRATATILVTNDDGYDAPGLAALIDAVAPLGQVFVAAPEREQSGSSHSLTLDRPLRVSEVAPQRYRISGTPTDCVHLAIPRLTGGRNPDLVVSGINRGLNVGDDVTYSGTVAAALEGALLHVPAVAFSIAVEADRTPKYQESVPLARRIASEVLVRGLPPGVLLNVNFPPHAARGVRFTRQGTRRYRATALERFDPAGRPYYWIDVADAVPTGEPDGDHVALREGWVSITPLAANLTHEPTLADLPHWPVEWT